MIRQFVRQEVCLECKGCCRFKEENSVWSPCLFDEEIQSLIDKSGIPAASLTMDKRLKLIALEGKPGFFCPFLNLGDNRCQIYTFRPFECQLYPFLINLRDSKVILTVDLKCPYAKEKINTEEFKEYSEYLANFLNSPAQIKAFKENPQIIQAYEEVSDVMTLYDIDEIE